jgi:hypothetical protein
MLTCVPFFFCQAGKSAIWTLCNMRTFQLVYTACYAAGGYLHDMLLLRKIVFMKCLGAYSLSIVDAFEVHIMIRTMRLR